MAVNPLPHPRLGNSNISPKWGKCRESLGVAIS